MMKPFSQLKINTDIDGYGMFKAYLYLPDNALNKFDQIFDIIDALYCGFVSLLASIFACWYMSCIFILLI